MIKKGSLYCASDKAFYDALCQHKMSKEALQELLWTRGVIRSSKQEKNVIAKYFSRINHDYFDHTFISNKISTGSNQEKRKSSYTSQAIEIPMIEKAVKELVDARKSIDNSIDYNVHENSVIVYISYSYYDHNKPEFKQLVSKSAMISVETLEEGVVIRAPDNEYVSEITQTLFSKLTESFGDELELETISLLGIEDVNLKTHFFTDLIAQMEGLDLKDVSDVAIYNQDTGEDEDSTGVRIKSALLKGEGVLNSGEVKQFYKKGFFIYKISWSMVETGKADSHVYTFQAQFNDPAVCRNFSYIAKGFYKNLGKGKHAKNPTAHVLSEEIRMMRKLERSARAAKDKLFNSMGSGDTNDEE